MEIYTNSRFSTQIIAQIFIVSRTPLGRQKRNEKGRGEGGGGEILYRLWTNINHYPTTVVEENLEAHTALVLTLTLKNNKAGEAKSAENKCSSSQ